MTAMDTDVIGLQSDQQNLKEEIAIIKECRDEIRSLTRKVKVTHTHCHEVKTSSQDRNETTTPKTKVPLHHDDEITQQCTRKPSDRMTAATSKPVDHSSKSADDPEDSTDDKRETTDDSESDTESWKSKWTKVVRKEGRKSKGKSSAYHFTHKPKNSKRMKDVIANSNHRPRENDKRNSSPQVDQQARQNTHEPEVVIGTGHSKTVRASHHQPVNRCNDRREGRYISGIMVTRLHPHTSAAHLAIHVHREVALTVRPEKMPTKYKGYSSFFIRANPVQRSKLLNKNIWPQNTLIKPFYEKY